MDRQIPPRPRARALGSWLIAPLLLLSVLFAVALVLRNPAGLFGWVFGALVAVALVWVVVSVLWPSSADRGCPECGQDALERLDPRSTHGLVCRACGWRDETRSSFLLAEEEGPLEETVLRERELGRGRKRNVDRSPATD